MRFWIALLGLIALVLPLNAGAQKEVSFPTVTGRNLEKRRVNLPGDLMGDLNIVILGFQRTQQSAIDTWIPAVRDLCATSYALRYYEIPVLPKMTKQAEEFINIGMYRGISEKSDRERTITLYLDKQPFEDTLHIPNEDTIHILLMDRQGRIVWRAEGKHTAEKATALAHAAQNWLDTRGPRIETLSGKAISLTDFRGKIVLLILSAKGPSRAAGLLLQDIFVGSGARSDVAYLTDADLTAAPGVLRGMIRSDVKGMAKKNHDRLLAALMQAGIPYTPQNEPVTLLDWQGVLTRQFSVSGKTERAYQVFVLDREGKTVFHYEQTSSDEKTTSPAPQILKVLQETALPKSPPPLALPAVSIHGHRPTIRGRLLTLLDETSPDSISPKRH